MNDNDNKLDNWLNENTNSGSNNSQANNAKPEEKSDQPKSYQKSQPRRDSNSTDSKKPGSTSRPRRQPSGKSFTPRKPDSKQAAHNNRMKNMTSTQKMRMKTRVKRNHSSVVTNYVNPNTEEEDRRIGMDKLVHANYETPKSFKENIKIIFLGGHEEVGKNMTAIEVGDDIIIIDAGLQFPEPTTPGIDYIIADTTYLQKNKAKIKGLVITHGHMDHIGGVDAVIRQIGYDIPVYGTPLTVGIIKKRQEEFAGSLKLIVFDPDNTIYFGKLKIGFFRVNHNIPDSVAVCVHTPGGIIVHTGDWKLDHSPVNEEAMNFLRAAEIGKQGVLALLADSTSAYLPGYALSEDEIKHNIDDVFRKTSGRIITACFSTLIARIQQLILLSEKYDRKVCILGRSMLNNVEVALNLDYMKIKKGTIISSKQAKTIDPSKVTIICTGAQGEGNASLTKVAKGEHKDIVMEDNDAVLFSSSVIKGNERSIQNLRDIIAKHNIEVYHYQMMDVHAGGHAKSEETKLMANLLRPKYFIPIEANYFMLKEHAKVIQTAGFPKERIFIPSNGAVLSITEKDAKIEHDVVSHNIIAVEGKTIGPLTDIVMNDRNQMAESGIFNIIINAKARKNINNPDIISRGYIYMKESKPLVEEARRLAKNLYEKAIQDFDGNIKDTKRHITTKIEELLFEKVGKVPLVIVVINDITTKDGHDDAELDEEGNILTSNNTIENTNINERNIIDNT